MPTRKVQIHPHAVVEDEVVLGSACIVEPHAVLRGPISTGPNCFFGAGCTVRGPARIGSSVYLAQMTVVGFPTQPEILAFQEGKPVTPGSATQPTTIGNSCIVRSGTVLYAGVQLGNNVRVGHNALLRESLTIGDNTIVGSGVIIDGHTSIGPKVSIQSGVYIPLNTTIEDHVFLGPRCILTNDKYVMRSPYELKGPTVRHGASVGAGAILMPGIEVGEEAVVGAGAVVTKNVAPKTIVLGVPAKAKSPVPKTWKIPFG